MHYKNGREAKIGDEIVGKNCSEKPIGGVLISINPQSDTCNGNVVPSIIIDRNKEYVNLKDCLHIEDLP